MESKKQHGSVDPVTNDSGNRIKQAACLKHSRQRLARILMYQVDDVLKKQGIEAAIKKLMEVRLTIPLNATIRGWLRDYRDMLDAWNNDLMGEVVDEFNEYGFRRARDLAMRCLGWVRQERLLSYYRTCERVLELMAERSRLSISDMEESVRPSEPEEISLEDVSEDQLQTATRY